jgi:competence protein ComEC
MSDVRVRARLMTLLIMMVLSVGVWVAPSSLAGTGIPVLTVSFLDVGQGDAILIESPTGQQLLVDGGRNSTVLQALGRELSFFDRDLDYVVATHPDQDHIGGLVDVFERYQVATVLLTENQSDTVTNEAFRDAVTKESARIIVAKRGQIIDLGGGVVVEVLWPEIGVEAEESNASSVVLLVRYGDVEFLLTGDAPKRIEEYLVRSYSEYLESEVLKVGHHGSRTSTSELFLAEVSPQFAVISASADNSYGHPHVEVTDALFNAGVEILSTAEIGTVTFMSDGALLWLE